MMDDPRFATNHDRVENRRVLVPILEDLFRTRPAGDWLHLFREAGVPCGPVNTVDRSLESPQARARGMVQAVDHPQIGPLRMVASPLKLEATPPVITRHPPMLGEHTDEVLREVLGRGTYCVKRET
jgi:crotonobetainyl-CoA:carnitine CoA-transferase CaiB-like acyl-CoA transferase